MKTYLLAFFAAIAALLAAVAALAWVADPYAYWDTPVIAGVNAYRPASGKHLGEVKQRQYGRVVPRTVVAGNSRVEVGIDPADAAWPAAMRPVYNFGLPGRGAAAVLEEVREALAVHRPKTILIGLDFLDYRFDAGDLAPPAPHRPGMLDRISLTTKLLLSLDALDDSLATLAEQHKAFPANIGRQGFNSLGEYNRTVAAEGHWALFAQRNAENMRSYLAGSKTVRGAGGRPHPGMAALESFIAEARGEGIRVVLFTYPYHADILRSFARAGLWPAFRTWTKDLATLARRGGVPLYEFTVLDARTTEPVPARGDRRTHMRWYWEGGHFKAALGTLMIADMTARRPRFGRLLTPDRTDAYLDTLERRLRALSRRDRAGGRRVQAALEASQG